MKRTIVATEDAPKAIGPYSQGIQIEGVEKMVFCSGQVGLDPKTQELVGGGVEPEARRALENLKAVLAASGVSMKDIVKTTIFLVDMGDFQRVNAIYAGFFEWDPPARATVAVAALPKNARVEIEAIAVCGD
jgi:2-iminobutanoate/2-iminopropanoate deaminase